MEGKRRRIIHIDMDAFFASVEELDHPSLRGLPIIVGGHQTKRGVVSSASYPARAFGVKAAMPLWQAKQLCPQGVYLPVRMWRYAEISEQLRALFLEYTPLVEPMGFDEAYLEVSGCEHLFGPALEIGRTIQRRVREELGLSCSVGISYNKFLSKIASGWKKPGGIVQILEEDALDFLAELPLEELPGVGFQTQKKLERMGLRRIKDLNGIPLQALTAEIGQLTKELLAYAQGIDPRPVIPFSEPKSMGEECTFSEDLSDPQKLLQVLVEMNDRLSKRLREEGYLTRRVTIKIRFPNFKTITRSQTLGTPTNTNDLLFKEVKELFLKAKTRRVRLLGLSFSLLSPAEEIATLFENRSLERQKSLCATLDKIQGKYGEEAISRAIRASRPKKRT